MTASPGKGKFGKAADAAAIVTMKDLLGSFDSVQSVQTIYFTEKEEIVKRGVTKEELATLKELFEFDYSTLATLLAVTDRTLHLKKGKDTFSLIVSDRIMAIVELYSYGYTVFGDKESFHTWMKQVNRSLRGRTPLNVIETHSGLLEVRALIGKIRRGVL